MTTEADKEEMKRNGHRIVAKSDLQALEKLWNRHNHQDDSGDDLNSTVDTAVWEMLLQLVRPVSDRAYMEHVSPCKDDKEESKNDVVPPTVSWEDAVDRTRLEGNRQLRSQVHGTIMSVQEKRKEALIRIEKILQEHRRQLSKESQATPQPQLLDAEKQKSFIQMAKQAQAQVGQLVSRVENMNQTMPEVIKHFRETLETVEAEEKRANDAMQVSSEDVFMLGQEEDVTEEVNTLDPAGDRLLQFLALQ